MTNNIQLDLKDFNASMQIIGASLTRIRDALILWKNANDRLEGEAAAMRGNLLNLIIDNLEDLVIQPIMEVRYK